MKVIFLYLLLLLLLFQINSKRDNDIRMVSITDNGPQVNRYILFHVHPYPILSYHGVTNTAEIEYN